MVSNNQINRYVFIWRAMLFVHYSDVIMNAMASETTGVSAVFSTVGSGSDQRKHQSSSALVPVTQQMFHLMTSSCSVSETSSHWDRLSFLTRCGLMTPYDVRCICKHCFGWWLRTEPLSESWTIVIWTSRDKFQWYWNQNADISFQEDAF